MIVLDTHVLVWWVNGESGLSGTARKAIEQEQHTHGHIAVSAISAWEIAMLAAKERLVLTMDVDDWLTTIGNIEGVDIAPLTPRIAVQSTRLPGNFHADPADRMIVAFTRENNALLLTADQRIQRYPHVRWAW